MEDGAVGCFPLIIRTAKTREQAQRVNRNFSLSIKSSGVRLQFFLIERQLGRVNI
jgi:hypothetical protein